MIGAAVLFAGAVLFIVLRGLVGVTADATPLLVGLPAVVAGVAGRRANLLAAGLTLTGFGLAVLAVRHGGLPAEREAPAVVVGVAVGLLLAAVATRWLERPGDLAVGGLAALGAGIAFWFAFDTAVVLSYWVWTAGLVAWAGAELWAARDRGVR